MGERPLKADYSYTLWLEKEVHSGRKRLPGKVRQRVKRALDTLASDPRPANSQPLDMTDLDIPAMVEIRRLRMEKWRVIYAVNDTEEWVWVLAIRQRPPYDYEDLYELATGLGD